MKALMKTAPGNGNIEICDIGEPECGDDRVKVEVAYCGVCGTDIHVMHDTYRNFPPVILGHELAGTVVEVGRKVKNARVGDRVAILGATAVTCGNCGYCRSGYFIFCKSRRGMGHGVDGGFTRFVVVRPDQLYHVPDSFSIEEAALSEPFAAVVQAVTELTPLQFGDTILISGPGPIGLIAVKLLVASGFKTIVAGAKGDSERLSAAKRYGAATVIDTNEKNLAEVIAEETKGEGVEVAFECAGHPSSVRNCMESLRPMGNYTQVAICGRQVEFPIDTLFYKQLTMRGSITYTEKTWDRVMKIYSQGKIRLHDLISCKLPISDWENAFSLCVQKSALKVLMYPE